MALEGLRLGSCGGQFANSAQKHIKVSKLRLILAWIVSIVALGMVGAANWLWKPFEENP